MGRTVAAMSDGGDKPVADLCTTAADAEPMMSLLDVRHFFGGKRKPIGVTTVWNWVRAGKLAKPIAYGPQTRRWRRSDCQKTLDAIIAASERLQKGDHT